MDEQPGSWLVEGDNNPCEGDKIRVKGLLNRNFFTDSPDEVWITDFNYALTRIGFTYASYVIDFFSRRILSWDSSISYDTDLVAEALQLTL